jgi:hypothetical protein
MKPPPWVLKVTEPLINFGVQRPYTLDKRTALKLAGWILTGTLIAGLWLQE